MPTLCFCLNIKRSLLNLQQNSELKFSLGVPCPWTLRWTQTRSPVCHRGLCIAWTSPLLPPGIQASVVLHHQYLRQQIGCQNCEYPALFIPRRWQQLYCVWFVLLKLAASGSSVLITMTFQSVSPSSIKARVPSTFTLITSPREHTWRLGKVTDPSKCFVDSFFFKGLAWAIPPPCLLCHIYRWDRCLRSIPCRCPCGGGPPMSGGQGGKLKHLAEGNSLCCWPRGGTHLGDGAIVPDVALVRKHVCHVSKVSLFHVLFQRIKGVLGGDLIRQKKLQRDCSAATWLPDWTHTRPEQNPTAGSRFWRTSASLSDLHLHSLSAQCVFAGDFSSLFLSYLKAVP